MNAIANGALNQLRPLSSESVDAQPTGMILLKVRLIHGATRHIPQILVLDIADHANNCDVELLVISLSFGEEASERILRRSVESSGKCEIDDCNLRTPLDVGR